MPVGFAVKIVYNNIQISLQRSIEMNQQMRERIKTIPSSKPVYLFQVIVYVALALFLGNVIRANGYTVAKDPDKLALWAGIWLCVFFAALQFFTMLVTKVEVYEHGVFLRKRVRKVALPFEAIRSSNWGKVKYAFFTIAHFLEFHYQDEKGRAKAIRIHSFEVSKRALKALASDYQQQIKFDQGRTASTQQYSGY